MLKKLLNMMLFGFILFSCGGEYSEGNHSNYNQENIGKWTSFWKIRFSLGVQIRDESNNLVYTTADMTISAGSWQESWLLEAKRNTIRVPSSYSEYTIRIEKSGYDIFERTYSKSELRYATILIELDKEVVVSGRILYTLPATNENDQEIYIMDGNGSNQVRLTDNNYSDFTPTGSPDGSKIAFKSNRDGEMSEIYTMDPDGQNQARITYLNGYIHSKPVWSPDSSKIAFMVRSGYKTSLYVINADGTDQILLVNHYIYYYMTITWSPDSTQIAFSYLVPYRDNYGVYAINADGSNLRYIAGFTDSDSLAYHPQWSPDGTRIAFLGDQNGSARKDLWVVNVDGSYKKQLTQTGYDEASPAWSPDGSKIVYTARIVRNNAVNSEICIIDPDSLDDEIITNNLVNDYRPSWSPDGTKIVFQSEISAVDGEYELYLMNPDGTSINKILDYLRYFSWLP